MYLFVNYFDVMIDHQIYVNDMANEGWELVTASHSGYWFKDAMERG